MAPDLRWYVWKISSHLSERGVRLEGMPDKGDLDVRRANYIIKLRPPYFVRYLKGKSPVCYIGSGRGWRIEDHKAWLHKMPLILENFKGYMLYGCVPRGRGTDSSRAYQKVEADLITLFMDSYGERPLFNSRLGSGISEYHFDDYTPQARRRVMNIFSCPTKVGFSRKIESIGRQIESIRNAL